jgi:hypothetical protein
LGRRPGPGLAAGGVAMARTPELLNSTAMSSTYRLLTPRELARTGNSKGSKRRVLKSIKRVTSSTPTITDRHFAELRLQERFGEAVTREAYKGRLQRGDVQPATKQARSAAEARSVRQFLPDIAPKHLSGVLKWYENGGSRGGWNSLSKREQETFRSVFSQYSRDDVRQALGSAPQDTGSFSMAA